MTRVLTPELLDSLPPDHPDAQHSRRDLRVINRAMGNHRWFARTLPPLLRARELALELGAGTGELAARLGRHGVAVDGLDRGPPPADWAPARTWHSTDLRVFDGYRHYPAVLGNLIFHHLTDDELAALGATLRRTARVILASEPTRSPRAQRLFAVLSPLFGANRVTQHDGRVSIAAGFVGGELPRALGLEDRDWKFHCDVTWLGGYRMIASRRS
ncbi:MAG: hypothetical protein EXS32_09770 [Opitutus sp.]|nr:hypothetical protein [Opitutus sp.]